MKPAVTHPWRKPGGKLANSRKHRYGLDADAFWKLYQKQGGKCAICQTEGTPSDICVDHNHDTGAVRGLLCKLCNWGLGQFRDNPQFLQAAITYLDKSVDQ